jgi:hypothetical protein
MAAPKGIRPPKNAKGAEERAKKRAAKKAANSKAHDEATRATQAKVRRLAMERAKEKVGVEFVDADTPRAKPHEYTDEIAERICECLSLGVNLRDFDRMVDFPSTWTIMRWVRDNKVFEAKYYAAMKLSALALEADAMQIAADGQNDTYRDHNGHVKTDWDVLGRSKLRVETIRWVASKRNPARYGEKIQQEHSGPGGGPVQTATPEQLARLNEEELDAYIRAGKKLRGDEDESADV